MFLLVFFFFFQAEDGIRDRDVTGVQTCALPIFIVDQRAFRVFIRTKSVALHSGADLFTDLTGCGSIYGSHSHRLDDAAVQLAETLPGCAGQRSDWLLSAAADSILAGESVI